MLKNDQTYFKNFALWHFKILKVCLAIFQHGALYMKWLMRKEIAIADIRYLLPIHSFSFPWKHGSRV